MAQDCLLKNNDLANAGRKHAQSEASEKISEAFSLPGERARGRGGLRGRRTSALGPWEVERKFCKLSG
jgi:hypothetical protein